MQKVILVLLLFFGLSANAQKISFTDSSNKWFVLGSEFDVGSWTFIYGGLGARYDGVVTHNGYVYNSLKVSVTDSILVREDTSIGKVYAIAYHYLMFSDTSEFVFFDYNLQVGDTFTTRGNSRRLQSLDSTLINGVWHRVYNMDGIGGAQEYTFIEGIGCMRDIMLPGYDYMFEFDRNVICFENSGSNPLVAPAVGDFDNSNSCDDIALTINKYSKNATAIVYPNPAAGMFTVKLPESLPKGAFRLYNNYGQLVVQKEFANQEELKVDSRAFTGMYFYSISNPEGVITYKGKIELQ